MTVGRAFRRLTRAIRQLEGDGWEVEDVRPAHGEGLCERASVHASVACRRHREAHGYRTVPEGLEADASISVRTEEVRTTSGGVRVRLRIEVALEDKHEPGPAEPETGPPLHADGDRLRELYRRHCTFGEMAEAVEQDVSPETLRRYMIEHDIHEPGADDFPGNGDKGDRPVLADGSGVEFEDFVDAVAHGTTIYDVQRRLELDRTRTRRLLEQCEVLDLVTGRLAEHGDPEDRKREVRSRLQEIPRGGSIRNR